MLHFYVQIQNIYIPISQSVLDLFQVYWRGYFKRQFYVYNNNMKRSIVRLFSTGKQFFDQNFQNISLKTANKTGSLHSLCNVFTEEGVNMTFVKSHFVNAWTQRRKYCLDVTIQKQTPQKLQNLSQKFNGLGVAFELQKPIKVPWFPKKISDLDNIGKVLLKVKDEVNRDHPQFMDKQYRKRRDYIAEVALGYKMGDKIPHIPYAPQQTQLWKKIYQKLSPLHKKGMSKRYLTQMNKIQKQFMVSKRIPQLNQINSYLHNKTGFTIKPTHGILSHRQFLNCFAFRVFCCTQYIRHYSTPQYTPQPDIVHEIVGHIPMFADPDVAQLSQQIGLLSLGATDQQIIQLGTLYWFTLQFGACLQGEKRLGYGAGIASSIAEIENLISGKPKFHTFNPSVDFKAPYPIQKVQESYRLTQNFEKAISDLQNFGDSILKPITTTFNFETKQIQYDRHIEAIDSGDKPIQFI